MAVEGVLVERRRCQKTDDPEFLEIIVETLQNNPGLEEVVKERTNRATGRWMERKNVNSGIKWLEYTREPAAERECKRLNDRITHQSVVLTGMKSTNPRHGRRTTTDIAPPGTRPTEAIGRRACAFADFTWEQVVWTPSARGLFS